MTHYEKIYEVAADNYGLITSSQAKQLGISDKEMSALAKRGRLVRRGHGVYKLVHYIPTHYDAYAEAVTLVGSEAYLYGESVIAMLELAPTNPSRVFIATPKRVRKALPKYITLVNADCAKVYYEGIPSQSAADAIRSAKKTMMSERLIAATNKAYAQRYISEPQKYDLIEELERK